MAKQQIYKIVFYNQDKVFEVFARQIYQSDLYGFIELEEIVFGERSKVVVDPNEEKLKAEFDSVIRSYVPIHSIIRIDEVEKEGIAKISEAGNSKVTRMPLPTMPSKDI